VVDSHDRPVAGATLELLLTRPARLQGDPARTRLIATSSSGADGGFALEAQEEATSDGQFELIARATDHAATFAPAHDLETLATRLERHPVRLAERVAVRGRLFDLDARPIAGSRVEVRRVVAPAAGRNDDWIRFLAELDGVMRPFEGVAETSAPERLAVTTAITDLDGRFVLDGFGRDLVLSLRIVSTDHESCDCGVITRPGISIRPENRRDGVDPVVVIDDRRIERRPPSIPHYGPEFEHAIAPAPRWHGRVVDRRSGAPIAGCVLHSRQHAARTVSGADGTFELLGMPMGASGGELLARPARGSPWFETALVLPERKTLEPANLLVELERGIRQRGRVVDEAGRPLEVQLAYHPFNDNRLALSLTVQWERPVRSDADGRFELPVLQGPGVIGVTAVASFGREFLRARPADFGRATEGGRILTGGGRVIAAAEFFALCPVEPAATDDGGDGAAEPVTIVLRRGAMLALRVESGGAPAETLMVGGIDEDPKAGFARIRGPSVLVGALRPGTPRHVALLDPVGRRGKLLELNGDESGERVVSLDPCGELRGRFIESDEQPAAAWPWSFEFRLPSLPDPSPGDTGNAAADGTFRMWLIPGLAYTARLPEEVTVMAGAGELVDLGVIRAGRRAVNGSEQP
jgi:hypothetical protein